MNLKALITMLYNGVKERNEYLYEVPKDLHSIFLDNKYINSLEDTNFQLLTTLLSTGLIEDIMWFLYEWKPGYSVQTWEKEYIINSLDEYIDYVLENYKQ